MSETTSRAIQDALLRATVVEDEVGSPGSEQHLNTIEYAPLPRWPTGISQISVPRVDGFYGLSVIAGSPFAAGTNPVSITADPSGQFVYVGNWLSNDVSAYTINETTGALASIAGSPYPVGAGPSALAVDPAGKFLYVANFWTDDITGFSLDTVSGDLVSLVFPTIAFGGLNWVITLGQFAAKVLGGLFWSALIGRAQAECGWCGETWNREQGPVSGGYHRDCRERVTVDPSRCDVCGHAMSVHDLASEDCSGCGSACAWEVA